jgi:anaerobic dimethyl sulfoxide reductase subunit A
MSEKDFLTKTLTETALTRRSFLKWSAALGGAAALAGGVGFGLKKVKDVAQAAPEGEWITASCWHNCGGRCLIKAQVVDGVVTMVKTDDTHPDSSDYPQQRACPRGRSQRAHNYGADRLKYPMVRKNWEPGGGKKELRGQDEWVRISWEEALNIVSSEINRIKDKYGNESILVPGGSEIMRTLALYGGYVSAWGSTSRGTWQDTGLKIGVGSDYRYININDRLDLLNSQLIVMWGMNPSWSSAGLPTYNYLRAKRAGAKFIFIDPYMSDTAKILADEWIPVRNATDHALALGIAYTLITEDDPIKSPLIDWDFLNRCTVGFDAEHMPEGVDKTENFKDYVLGTHDGQPKDREWASEICGVPPEKIKALAIEIGSTPKVTLHSSFAPSRVQNQDSWPQMFITLGCITGNIGLPGKMTGVSAHVQASDGGPMLVTRGGNGFPGIPNPISNVRLNNGELWEAVNSGKYTAGKNDIRDINIQMIYHGGNSALNQKLGTVKGIQAHRKVEFVVTQNLFLNPNAAYSDVVLPITTEWERYATFPGDDNKRREFLVFARQITEPMFETKDDIWVAAEIGARLGLDPKEIAPFSPEQTFYNQLSGSTVIKKDGSGYEPLVTITSKDISEMGVEGDPQEGRITYQEYKQKGIYQVQRYVGDNYGFIALKDFREDPEGKPLNTPSGKIEIHCQSLADLIDSLGWSTIKPIPAYNKPIEGYEATFSDWERRVKGEYPLQLYTIHYMRRSHSIFDNVPWLRKIYPQEFMMNPIDAEIYGIKQGDIVKITSPHGVVIRPVYITERMMPGVTTLGQGAWVEMDEKTEIDKAGSTNVLTGGIATGQGHSGWNTVVKVEKYDEVLLPDHKWPQRIPLKEA